MIGLLKNVKEVLYDLIGYILPGFVSLVMLLIPISIQEFYSPIYALICIANIPNQDINSDLFNISAKYAIFILLISYILGHLLNGLGNKISKSNFFETFIKPILNKSINSYNEKFSYLSTLEKECWSIIRDSSTLPNNIFVKDGNDIDVNKNLLITYATTTSRFKDANNLIQKYISKTNMYTSLCCISILLLIDTLISGIYIMFNTSNLNYNQNLTLTILAILSILFYNLFTTFYNEFYRHTKLKEKECYFYIIDSLQNKK